jgi:hypothetical protein
MRSANPRLGETTIKVPAPFAGISDLGFTAQYRAQAFNEPLRDVPLLFEGPEPPLRRLVEQLHRLSEAAAPGYAWTDPVMLSDEVVVLAFKDRSLPDQTGSDGGRLAGHLVNLVRPVVFTFLRDCASIAHLRLSDVIEMRVSAGRRSFAELTLPRRAIVQPNGERLLWS